MNLPTLEIPEYTTTLPVSGQTVTYRPYLVKEEKSFLVAMESKNDVQIMKAAQSLVEVCTFRRINVRELTSTDFLWIFIQLRKVSGGEIIETAIKCPKCGETLEVEINLDNLKTSKEKSVDPKIQLTPEVGVVLKYPTMKLADVQSDSGVDYLADCIETIFTKDQLFQASEYKREELVKFVDQLNEKQLKLAKAFLDSEPSLEYDLEHKCEHCGHEFRQTLTEVEHFFT